MCLNVTESIFLHPEELLLLAHLAQSNETFPQPFFSCSAPLAVPLNHPYRFNHEEHPSSANFEVSHEQTSSISLGIV